MTKPDDPRPDGSDAIVDETDTREAYEAPRFDSEELFETLALACGKIQPQTFACQRVNRQS